MFSSCLVAETKYRPEIFLFVFFCLYQRIRDTYQFHKILQIEVYLSKTIVWHIFGLSKYSGFSAILSGKIK